MEHEALVGQSKENNTGLHQLGGPGKVAKLKPCQVPKEQKEEGGRGRLGAGERQLGGASPQPTLEPPIQQKCPSQIVLVGPSESTKVSWRGFFFKRANKEGEGLVNKSYCVIYLFFCHQVAMLDIESCPPFGSLLPIPRCNLSQTSSVTCEHFMTLL